MIAFSCLRDLRQVVTENETTFQGYSSGLLLQCEQARTPSSSRVLKSPMVNCRWVHS